MSYVIKSAFGDTRCDCWTCKEERERDWDVMRKIGNQRMIVCATCGNKRCPHATDHRLECTASNKPGQPGSAYEHGSGAATARRFGGAA